MNQKDYKEIAKIMKSVNYPDNPNHAETCLKLSDYFRGYNDFDIEQFLKDAGVE